MPNLGFFDGQILTALKGGDQGFPTSLEGTGVFRETLRLHLGRLERQGTQEDQKQMQTPELLPNPKIRIMTIFNQFRDKAARIYDCDIFPFLLSQFESLLLQFCDRKTDRSIVRGIGFEPVSQWRRLHSLLQLLPFFIAACE